MTTIRATCPQCGEVEMDARSILLQVEQESGEGSYSFDCPTCELPVEKPADRKIVLLLMSAGVEVMEAQEIPSPETRPEGPPFTSDDLIDFHFLLQQTDWFEQLVADAR
jgi:hypothetical protein